MTAATLTYNVPALATPFDNTKANYAAPTVAQQANGWVDNVDVVSAEQQNYLHNTSTTYLWLVQQLGLAMPFNPDGGGASLVATPKGGIVSIKNSSTGATEFYIAKNTRAVGYTDPSLDPTNWVLFNVAALAQFTGFYADAGGTVDAITASYTVPYPVLVDGFPLEVHVAGANTSTTPTFTPTLNGNVQTTRTIVKIVNNAAVALAAGDLNGVCQLRYDLTNTRWILTNPFSVHTTQAILSSSSSLGIGYESGAGNTGTMSGTSNGSSVTINAMSGLITIPSNTWVAGNTYWFYLSNSSISTTDSVILNFKNNTTHNILAAFPKIIVSFMHDTYATGVILLYVVDGATTALDIKFSVIKGVNA